MTTKKLLTEWLNQHAKEHIKARTHNRYEELINLHIIPSIGNLEIKDVSRKSIQSLIVQKKISGNLHTGEKLSSSSVNMILSILNSAFEYACDMEYIYENPCSRVKKAKHEAKRIEAFTAEEQKKIELEILASNDKRLHGILLCLYTGIRIGELLALTWDDIDFSRNVLQITKTVYKKRDKLGLWSLCIDEPKTKSSVRTIPLTNHIVKILKKDRKNAASKYVVETKKGGQMPTRSYQYIFAKLTSKVDVRNLNFHALRHTFATRALECGIDVKTVSDIMGHQNASVTLNCYAHCLMEHKIEMMKKLTVLQKYAE